MNRILVAPKSRSEIDLPKNISYLRIFGCPLPIFAPDGSLYYAKGKSVIATQLREFQPGDTAIEEGEKTNSRKVLIMDDHCKQNRYKS